MPPLGTGLVALTRYPIAGLVHVAPALFSRVDALPHRSCRHPEPCASTSAPASCPSVEVWPKFPSCIRLVPDCHGDDSSARPGEPRCSRHPRAKPGIKPSERRPDAANILPAATTCQRSLLPPHKRTGGIKMPGGPPPSDPAPWTLGAHSLTTPTFVDAPKV